MTDDPATTDGAATTDSTAKTPNVPLAILACAGLLSLLVSGILWGSNAQIFDGYSDPLPWKYLDPTTAGWIVVLFWVGILCVVGALVAAAVGFSIDNALQAHATGATSRE
jgi:hypothetical protein